MSYNLFLDDYRTPEMVTWKRLPAVQWLIVADFAEFKEMVDHAGVPDFVSYDHDLADIHHIDNHSLEMDGVECAKYMVDYCRKRGIAHPPYEVHSMNPIGAARIRNTIEDYQREYYQDHPNQ